MKKLIFFPLCMLAIWLHAQPVVKVVVSADTIAIGEKVDVTYTIEGGEGLFYLPDLSALPVFSGPNSSSSYIYQNGKMNSSQSYSLTLLAVKEGKLTIPGTTYQTNEDKIAIQSVDIIVVAERASSSSKTKTDPPSLKSTREKRKF